MTKSQEKSDKTARKIVVENKKARFNYIIEEVFQAGLVLNGPEIKSVRAGQVNLSDSYVSHQTGELWLVNAHISKYAFLNDPHYDPTRKRKLLMHKLEIQRLAAKVEQKGFTLVPLDVHLVKGKAKLSLALAKGKNAPDKRRTSQERELKREAERAMKRG